MKILWLTLCFAPTFYCLSIVNNHNVVRRDVFEILNHHHASSPPHQATKLQEHSNKIQSQHGSSFNTEKSSRRDDGRSLNHPYRRHPSDASDESPPHPSRTYLPLPSHTSHSQMPSFSQSASSFLKSDSTSHQSNVQHGVLPTHSLYGINKPQKESTNPSNLHHNADLGYGLKSSNQLHLPPTNHFSSQHQSQSTYSSSLYGSDRKFSDDPQSPSTTIFHQAANIPHGPLFHPTQELDRNHFGPITHSINNSISSNYDYRYEVMVGGNGPEFGHQEAKSEGLARGQYKVLLPDGRVQIVQYEADQFGFRPRVSYEHTSIQSQQANTQDPLSPQNLNTIVSDLLNGGITKDRKILEQNPHFPTAYSNPTDGTFRYPLTDNERYGNFPKAQSNIYGTSSYPSQNVQFKNQIFKNYSNSIDATPHYPLGGSTSFDGQDQNEGYKYFKVNPNHSTSKFPSPGNPNSGVSSSEYPYQDHFPKSHSNSFDSSTHSDQSQNVGFKYFKVNKNPYEGTSAYSRIQNDNKNIHIDHSNNLPFGNTFSKSPDQHVDRFSSSPQYPGITGLVQTSTQPSPTLIFPSSQGYLDVLSNHQPNFVSTEPNY